MFYTPTDNPHVLRLQLKWVFGITSFTKAVCDDLAGEFPGESRQSMHYFIANWGLVKASLRLAKQPLVWRHLGAKRHV